VGLAELRLAASGDPVRRARLAPRVGALAVGPDIHLTTKKERETDKETRGGSIINLRH